MTQTKIANLVNPEVMGDMIAAKLPKKLQVIPFAAIDRTLQGVPGDTITVPSYTYIGDAEDVNEGVEAGLQLEDSLTLEEIAQKVEAGELDFLYPLEIGTGDLVKVNLTPEQADEVRYGRFIELECSEKEVAAFEGENLLAIMEKRDHLYKPRKVFS